MLRPETTVSAICRWAISVIFICFETNFELKNKFSLLVSHPGQGSPSSLSCCLAPQHQCRANGSHGRQWGEHSCCSTCRKGRGEWGRVRGYVSVKERNKWRRDGRTPGWERMRMSPSPIIKPLPLLLFSLITWLRLVTRWCGPWSHLVQSACICVRVCGTGGDEGGRCLWAQKQCLPNSFLGKSFFLQPFFRTLCNISYSVWTVGLLGLRCPLWILYLVESWGIFSRTHTGRL